MPSFEGSDRLVQQLEEAAAGLRRAAGSAGGGQVTAEREDGRLQVVADGTPRLAAVRIDPRLLRRPVDELARLLTAAADEALHGACEQRRSALVGALPPGMRATAADGVAPQATARPRTPGLPPELAQAVDGLTARVEQTRARAEDVAGRSFEGSAADGTVTAVVTGDGRVREIRLGREALRRPDTAALADAVVTATNAALALVAEQVAGLIATDVAPDLGRALAAFSARMDGIVAQLDAVSRNLDV